METKDWRRLIEWQPEIETRILTALDCSKSSANDVNN
jgi:hypothetical protein